MPTGKGRKNARGTKKAASRSTRSPRARAAAVTESEAKMRSQVIALFREAVLIDQRLQDRLRDTDTCGEVAGIANAYLKENIRIVVSGPIDRSPLREQADRVVREVLEVTEEDLLSYISEHSTPRGEVMLGESELALVAGSPMVAGSASCYGCSCGATSCCISVCK
jgi:hypothetical protein